MRRILLARKDSFRATGMGTARERKVKGRRGSLAPRDTNRGPGRSSLDVNLSREMLHTLSPNHSCLSPAFSSEPINVEVYEFSLHSVSYLLNRFVVFSPGKK